MAKNYFKELFIEKFDQMIQLFVWNDIKSP